MSSLTKEVDKNCDDFSAEWPKTLASSISSIDKLSQTKAIRYESYRRLTSLQAWRSYVLEPNVGNDSLAFFLEAQNDALISHVNALMGASRVALKALRSLVENTLCMIYYMDHPVELRMWADGKHRLGFTELLEYLRKHPEFVDAKDAETVTGLDLLKREYRQLSAAVHGSSKSFRMTEDGKMPTLWTTNAAKLGKWRTREKATLLAVNLVLLTFFRQYLQGSAQPQLRRSLAFSIPKAKDAKIKKHLGVTIKR